MVEEQIIARGITDPATIEAMRKVKRHLFVPDEEKPYAYNDYPLPIGYNQTISQPYIVAYMTEKLQLKPDDRVLEIGTGSGYQTAILAEIVAQVYSVEIIRELGNSAQDRLNSIGYHNIEIKSGDGYYGWQDQSPFDAIIVAAAATSVPEPLISQLAVTGRMIIPIGAEGGVQNLILVTKNEDQILQKPLLPVRFVPFTRV